MDDSKPKHWTPILERHSADIAEQSQALQWGHIESHKKFNRITSFLNFPVIILSAIVGFSQGASSSMFEDPKISNLSLGGVSLFIGVLNTISSVYGFAARSEAHKNASVNYFKLFHLIQTELKLPREERIQSEKFLKIITDEFVKLKEGSPVIPDDIINTFKSRFKKYKDKIVFPNEMNGLISIDIYPLDISENIKPIQPIQLLNHASLPIQEKRIPIRRSSSSDTLADTPSVSSQESQGFSQQEESEIAPAGTGCYTIEAAKNES